MSKFRVFISHSAKDRVAAAVLNKLNDGLSKNFEVLLDKQRLSAGVEWQLEIFSWLGHCHAAVILLSEDALKSSWVLQESTILNWRRQYEKQFTIIPALLPSVSEDSLDDGWFSAINLRRIQMVKGETADEIVRSVVEAVESHQSQLEETRKWVENFYSSGDAGDGGESEEPVEQVAALCYEKKRGRPLRFRLINTRSETGAERWIFPKGRVNTGEPLWLSALLEARREAGVAGDVERRRFATFDFWKEEGKRIKIAAFLLRVEAIFAPRQKGRNSTWFTPEEAKEKLALNRKKGRHAKNLEGLWHVVDEARKACAGK